MCGVLTAHRTSLETGTKHNAADLSEERSLLSRSQSSQLLLLLQELGSL